MEIFIEIGIIIFIATIVSLLMRFLKQPLVIGYILTGILVGPYLLNLVQSSDYIELFSKFGIAILLFIVGINLKPDVIREVGKISLFVGLGQIIFTSIIGFFIFKALNFDLWSSILGATALTFSSTIIILKLISDKDDLEKIYAKISIGMLLVQDIVASLVLFSLTLSKSSSLNINGGFFLILIKGFAFFILLYYISKYFLPKLLAFMAKSQELLFLFSISWGIGLASVFHLLGFSIEIGALAAGVAFASSPFSSEIGSRMKPLRDFFILLFFVMLGSQMILSNLSGIILPAILLSLFVLIGNPIIVMFIMNKFGYRSRISFLTGLTVAQISEFSLILVALGSSLGYVNKEFVSLITLVGIITIAGSTYFFIYAEKIYKKIKPLLRFFKFYKKWGNSEDILINDNDMIIFGYDRVGYDFVKVAEKINSKFFVVDFDPKAIEKLKINKIPNYFGDAEDIDFLEEIKMPRAKIIISTIPDFKTNFNLISFYRNHNKDGIIVITSHNIKEAKELYRIGASFVVMPHYLGAKYASEMIKAFGHSKEEFEREKMKHLMDLNERLALTHEGFNF
jgi:Kef-type K+ transport system membrane component KefB